MDIQSTTIAAISTAMAPSGIGIIRISGSGAIQIADKIFRGKTALSSAKTHTLHYGKIYCGEEIIDSVLVLLMKAPNSFTGEDTIEIDCHGGVLVLQKILEIVLKAGAALAEPGEFTKRAFLNGKMDLSQAEAVMDIINAENEKALRLGASQMEGKLSEKVRSLRTALLHEIAFIEAALDDPEHYNLSGYGAELFKKLRAVKDETEKLFETSDRGIFIKQGIDTAIIGRPNSGKSSIYNLLAGEERAIVTDIEGTTRDILREHIRLKNVNLNLVDTAGIREGKDIAEKIGIEKAKKEIEKADLIIAVIDGANSLSPEDIEVLKYTSERKSIILINKSDLSQKIAVEEIKKFSSAPIIIFSAKTGIGKEDLENCINEMFFNGEMETNDNVFITSARHKKSLSEAINSLELAIEGAERGESEDMIVIDITDAYVSLGKITGETLGSEIIDEIFSKFCMGK